MRDIFFETFLQHFAKNLKRLTEAQLNLLTLMAVDDIEIPYELRKELQSSSDAGETIAQSAKTLIDELYVSALDTTLQIEFSMDAELDCIETIADLQSLLAVNPHINGVLKRFIRTAIEDCKALQARIDYHANCLSKPLNAIDSQAQFILLLQNAMQNHYLNAPHDDAIRSFYSHYTPKKATGTMIAVSQILWDLRNAIRYMH